MRDYIVVDAHVHLWEVQQGRVNGRPVVGVGNGKSDFGGEIRQMMPPYMNDNRNTAERLLANMDYAGVFGCCVTQEYIDGNQDEYLLQVRKTYPDRFRVCSLYEDYRNQPVSLDRSDSSSTAGDGQECLTSSDVEKGGLSVGDQREQSSVSRLESTDYRLGHYQLDGFDGVKICAGRLADQDLKKLLPVFRDAEAKGKFISIDMADGDAQVEGLQYLIDACPDLRVAIGHFGMVTTDGWQKQIALAKNKNVYIESGGLTWLFHREFYPYPSAVEAILEASDICGMDKLMWGSDYPRTMTDITYIMAVRFIAESGRLSEEEKRAFLGGNAMRFYGFDKAVKMPVIGNML